MFIIKSLKLYGFKSFPKETRIKLARGVTAIVGPNGSGKSNISDALLWVMGEQSVKSLRGDSMEDIVFNGSDKLAPMGMASVELKIENTNPKKDEEKIITIERKYFRTGEGEYRLNGKRVRRKDIQEFLLEIGLGSKSYSIIEQGKIGVILSSKAEDRRYLIEDAAGILKYKMKKKEAQGKIRLTNENLERVEDIIAEVKRNLNSLRQQASRAKQFKKIQEELISHKYKLFAHKGAKLKESLSKLEKEKAVMENDNAALLAEIAKAQHLVEAAKTEILNKEQEISILSREFFDKKIKSERLEAELLHGENKLKDLKKLINEYEETVNKLEGEIKELEKTKINEEKNYSLAKDDIEHIAERKEEFQEKYEQLKTITLEKEQEFTEVDRNLKKLENYQLELNGKYQALNNLIKHYIDETENKKRQKSELEKEINSFLTTIEEREALLLQTKDKLEGLQHIFDEKSEFLAETEKLLKNSKDNFNQIQIEKQTLQNNIAQMESFITGREGFSENVKKLFEEKKELIEGVVGDFIETDGVHDAALEPFISNYYQIIVPKSFEALKQLVEYCKYKKINGVSFLNIEKDKKVTKEGVLKHLTLVKNNFGNFANYLSQIKIVPTLEEGFENNCSFITLSGDYFVKDSGIVSVGERDEHGFLSIKTAIKKGKKELVSIEKREKAEWDKIEQLEIKVENAKESLNSIKDEIDKCKLEISSIEAAIEGSSSHLKHRKAEKNKLTVEIEAKEQQLAKLNNDKEEMADRLNRNDAEIERLMLQREEKNTNLEETKEMLEQVFEELSELKLLYEKRISTVNGIEKELQFIERRLIELHSGLKKAEEGKENDLLTKEKLEKELQEKRKEANRIVEKYREIDKILESKKLALTKIRQQLEKHEKEVMLLKRQENEKLATTQKLELQIYELNSALKHLNEKADELTFEKELVFEQAENFKELEEKVDKLEKRAANFGIVNLLAIKECEEQEERYEFLTAQREDLLQSIKNLNKDIKEIDETTMKLFKEAFDFVNEKFSDIFVKLFGGGKAKLQLNNPDDLLETGIDIFAQPPGKKIQNITLMSGGEKALTALALLFAIFEYRIAPLCVLDEVDAPLDEANVIQFGHFLKQYRENVQFIIITHNKTTMEMVDSIYGVTMEEPGCSKLISVKLGSS
jgi:chromosome segregation protein